MSRRISICLFIMIAAQSCIFREIDYSFYDLSQVSVIVEADSACTIPDNLEVVFYNQSNSDIIENEYADSLTRIFVPSGLYDVLLFNSLSENNRFRLESFLRSECFTDESVYKAVMATKGSGENVILSPDELFVGSVPDVEIFRPVSGRLNIVRITVSNVIDRYRFFIPVKGIDYIVSATGLVSGMAGAYNMVTGAETDPPCSIILDVEKGENDGVPGLWCSFNTFGIVDSSQQILYMFDIKKPDGTSQSFEYDISELLENDQYVVPSTIVVDYSSGQNAFQSPEVGVWQDTSQIIILN